MKNAITDSINRTKEEFEKSFSQETLYNQQTRDSAHLQQILALLPVKVKSRILDLGTGSGYLAFAMAKQYNDSHVVGLDIVEQTLKDNRQRAIEEGLTNVEFITYDGQHFPMEKESFNVVTARYCLHHFPQIEESFQEISRVLAEKGYFFLADPTPNEDDAERFVDDYMRMKNDGHIKYYTLEEFVTVASKAGLQLVDAVQTEITFPRLLKTAYGFEDIMRHHKKKVIDGYGVRQSEDGKYIFITQKVNNLLFKKDE